MVLKRAKKLANHKRSAPPTIKINIPVKSPLRIKHALMRSEKQNKISEIVKKKECMRDSSASL